MSSFTPPLDRIRWYFIRGLGPLGRRLVVDRELRVAVGGCMAVATALTLTLMVPLWLMALGPLILGVPHLLADVRYLVVQPGLHRRREWWIFCAVPVALAGVGAGIGPGLLGVAGAFWIARGTQSGRKARVVIALLVALGAWMATRSATLFFAHAHNLIAVLLWWSWRERVGVKHRVALGAMAVGVAVLLSGVADGWVLSSQRLAWAPSDLGIDVHLASLAPGLPAPWGMRLVLLFAFAQSIHYAVWLRLVPDEARGRPTPRTFRATVAQLEQEFSPRVLWGVVAIAVGLGLWAFVDVSAARTGYLGIALFHGYLELSVAALWLAEGRPR